jgi:hypothetical protein
MSVLYSKYDPVGRLTAYKVRAASQGPPGKIEAATGNFQGMCGLLGALEYKERRFRYRLNTQNQKTRETPQADYFQLDLKRCYDIR